MLPEELRLDGLRGDLSVQVPSVAGPGNRRPLARRTGGAREG